jgi:hypothetical protein
LSGRSVIALLKSSSAWFVAALLAIDHAAAQIGRRIRGVERQGLVVIGER